jgi:hypothetical protein
MRPARRFAITCTLLALGSPPAALATAQAGSAEAGDGSRFFVIPYPIVDPALGNGLLLGPVWMRGGPPPAAGPAKPQAFGAGALWTDGGTRGVVAFDHRAWKGGTWRTTALVGDVELHFAYAGLRRDDDFGFVIAARGGSLSAERTLGASPNTLNFSVFSAQADVSPAEPLPIGINRDFGNANLTGVTLGWLRDTRDDVFLPSTGSALSATATVIPEAFGASFDSQSLALKATLYRPMGPGVLGLRAKADLGFGNPPFYLRPFVSFRGVAALRYAGEQALVVEAEYRQPIRGQWHGLVFAAAGHSSSDFRGFDLSSNVSAVGVGVRYKAEKLFGLTFGVDVAQGPDGTVGYLQIGNAWTN